MDASARARHASRISRMRVDEMRDVKRVDGRIRRGTRHILARAICNLNAIINDVPSQRAARRNGRRKVAKKRGVEE